MKVIKIIKRKYDKYNSMCYVYIECDFCHFKPVYVNMHGVKSKEIFSELEKDGWEKLKDGRIICTSCKEESNKIKRSI